MAALGRQRPPTIVSAQGPLSGGKQTLRCPYLRMIYNHIGTPDPGATSAINAAFYSKRQEPGTVHQAAIHRFSELPIGDRPVFKAWPVPVLFDIG
jgi:hypothetical protein